MFKATSLTVLQPDEAGTKSHRHQLHQAEARRLGARLVVRPCQVLLMAVRLVHLQTPELEVRLVHLEAVELAVSDTDVGQTEPDTFTEGARTNVRL